MEELRRQDFTVFSSEALLSRDDLAFRYRGIDPVSAPPGGMEPQATLVRAGRLARSATA